MNIAAGTRERLRALGDPSEDVTSWVEAELDRRALARELADTQAALAEARRDLDRLGSTDALTSLATGHRLVNAIEQSFARTQRQGSQLALLLVELDDQAIVGDDVEPLVALADVLRWVLRSGDNAGRLDERRFVVVAEPVTGCEGAIALAHRILDATRAPRVGRASLGLPVTIGGCVSGGRSTPADAIQRADAMLRRVRERDTAGMLIAPID